LGKIYPPSELVVCFVVEPVAGSRRVSVALGMTEPEGSVTVPARLPAVVACASRRAVEIRRKIAIDRTTVLSLEFMLPSWPR
jgi:hypothetical protein